jgi:membrane-bound serine protease (ClpP class)
MMIRNRHSLFLLLVLSLTAFVSRVPAQAQSEGQVLLLAWEGPISPIMNEYLQRGISTAEQRDAEALILQLDTPGGSLEVMQDIVSTIRGSSVPIIVYVAPSGAIAGSAGTVITLAGHLAAMAPETAIGAASPVGAQGEDLGETIRSKTEQILKAQIRSIASHRGEEALAFAEETVESARAASAQEALAVGLVDYLAVDIPTLLDQIDGREVETTAGNVTLNTDGVVPEIVSLTLIEQLLQTLTNPNIVFILLIIGAQAILIELSSPGSWVPGFVGAVCLSLAAYGLGVLPVNWFGIIFLGISFVLFILDVEAPAPGALTAAGAGSLIIGALILFNSPGTPSFQRVSIWVVVGGSLFTGGIFALLMAFAARAQKAPIRTGQEALVGKIGFARSEITAGAEGEAHVAGELWTAELAPGEDPAARGDRIQVVAAEGIHLIIRKAR